MRIPINLASDPFRRDRPILVATGVAAALLGVLLCGLVYLIVADRTRLGDTRARVNRLNGELATISAEQARLDTTLRQPANASVLERSLLLNTLVERKSVSWTKIFADLEAVMPLNVRLIQVRLPQINSRNEVLLDMVVGSQSPEPMIAFLKQLQASPRFGPATVHNSAPPTDNEPLYRYRVSVNYAQKLSRSGLGANVWWRIALGALLAATIAAAVFVIYPPGGSAEELKGQLAALEAQTAAKRALLASTRQHVAAVEQGRAEGDKFLNEYFLARRTAYSTLLTELVAAADEAKIKPKEHAYATEPIEGSDTLSMMSISANYEGTYANLMRFVHELDRSPRLLIIEGLNAAPQATGGTLNISMKIDTFVREDGLER